MDCVSSRVGIGDKLNTLSKATFLIHEYTVAHSHHIIQAHIVIVTLYPHIQCQEVMTDMTVSFFSHAHGRHIPGFP